MKQLYIQVCKTALIIFSLVLLISCSSNSQLEKLGYSEQDILAIKENKIEKTIIKNKISLDEYNQLLNNEHFNKDNLTYYLSLLNSNYEITDIDKIILGVNKLAKESSRLLDEISSKKGIETDTYEQVFIPKLEFKSDKLSASTENDKIESIKSIVVAESVFDKNIIEQVNVTSDLNLAKIGTYNVKIDVQDSKGYSASIEKQISVIDDVTPTLKVADKINIFKGESTNLLDFVKATDNLDGDITDKVKLNTKDFSSDVPGSYIVEFTVADSSGNEIRKTPIVNVLNLVNFKETFTINKYNITVNSCSYNRTDSEPEDYYYHYYNAGEEQVFLICNVKIKNEHDIQRSPFEIFGNDSERLEAKLIYDDKYEYDTVAHGLNNNWYYGFKSLKPLTSDTNNLTFEIPQEVRDSDKSVVLQFSTYNSDEDSTYIKIK